MWIVHLNTTKPLLRAELANLAIPFKRVAMQGQISPFRKNGFQFLTSISSIKLPDLFVTSQIGRYMLPTSK